jgi:glycosyltransferase involved in cell wall biosynthesis
VRLVLRLWRVRPGVIIGTRLGLNAMAGTLAPAGTAAVGQDQMNLSAKGPARQQTVRERYPALDALVVLTERDARGYREVLPDSVRLERIPNTARLLEGGPAPLTSPVVLGAGRLTWQKGFDRLILAWATLAEDHPDWSVRICGDGVRREKLQTRIDNNGLSDAVTLLGRVSDIEREMAGAAMFVLSSRYEGFPLVVLEAMSMGLPIVSFDCPTGPREIVEHGRTGLLVPDGDIEALAGAIRELIDDEERRRAYGRAASAAAAEYSVGAVGRRWDALLEEMRRRRNGAGL